MRAQVAFELGVELGVVLMVELGTELGVRLRVQLDCFRTIVFLFCHAVGGQTGNCHHK